MKKVLLVTIYDNHNFGNRLQNYALQKVVESYNFEVTTLDDRDSKIHRMKGRIKGMMKRMEASLKNQKKIIRPTKAGGPSNSEMVLKFNQNNFRYIKKTTSLKSFFTDWSSYDLAIAGSDQIWHKWSKFDPLELPYYYLRFMPREKRVSYAASFGFEEFPKKDRRQHRIGLNGMREISCREESGCRLVEELTGRRVPRVLDPTLLLSADEWRELEKQADGFGEKQGNYAFAFFLGVKSDEYREYMAAIMKEKGIDKLIEVYDEKIGACGPCEFLSLIDHAQFVFTDSFHCTVFSTIFEKNFTAFRRVQSRSSKMFGRIEDLLSSTNQLDHIYGGSRQTPQNNFDQLRRESIQYLETVLKIANEH